MGKFQKGQSGNPKGRPKKGLAAMDDLDRAIRKVEKEKRITLMEHFVTRAFENDAVLMSLLKKKLPDLKQAELNAVVAGAVNISQGKKVPEAVQELIDRVVKRED